MGLTKQEKKNNRVVWKREPKAYPSESTIQEIILMPPELIKIRPTEEKRIWFYSKIERIKKEGDNNGVILLIERANVSRGSFEQFGSAKLDLKKDIYIHFIDEIAQDAGGLIREWFTLIIEHIFLLETGLFQKANVNELSYIINENSNKIKKNDLDWFYFCGQIFAKALFERIPIKGYLNNTILKHLLKQDIEYSDLQYFDSELWNSINYLRTTRVKEEDDFGNFTINNNGNNVELKKNGNNILIEESNKEEFIELFIDYHLRKKSQKQLNKFCEGFYSLIEPQFLAVFDLDELEFFICGDSELDLNDWKVNTDYRGLYNEHNQMVQWFWLAIEKLNEEEKRKFLQFCTGSTRVPVEGFKGLISNSNKVCKFCIEPIKYIGPDYSFIKAHTCFNRIELPQYPSFDIMEQNIKTLLDNPLCSNFTFA